MLRHITLIFALSLILTIAFPAVDAHIDTHLVHRHAPALNRMIKKRASSPLGAFAGNNAPANAAPVANVASVSTPPAPSANTDAATSSDIQHSASTVDLTTTPVEKPSATTPVVPTQTSQASLSSSSTPASLSSVINSIVSPLSANVSSSSSTSSTSIPSSTPTSLTSSTPSSTPSTTQSSTPTPVPQTLSSIDPVTITSSATAPASTAASTSSGSVTKLQRNTIIILIAIGASLGAAGIIWTIIRKWKFSPSRSSDDRLQPIDWQPTTGPHDDHDITEKLTRNGSTRSHGSFTSGNNNHDNLAPDLPSHDFTAGPAHLAPVGGYADLHRGPSPQPDLHRGPSSRTPGDYQYEIPNPHGQYYNGASVSTGAGGYQGGYDYNRGY